MALGTVTVNALNQQQGAPTAVEKLFLYVGLTTDTDVQDQVLHINSQSDLTVIFGTAAVMLKKVLTAAKDNAGENWNAIVVPIADISAWSAAVDLAIINGVDFEAVVVARAVTTSAQLTAMQTKATALLSAHGMRVFFMTTTNTIDISGADESSQTWDEYISSLSNIVDGVVAPSVMVVPALNNNALLGVLAGRLCNSAVSIADSPMRVKTGAIIGITKTSLVDTDNVPYSNSVAKALNDLRFTVPQLYRGYEGLYWSDGSTLDEVTGDFKVIEYLRVINKAARLIYYKSVTMIADRAFNDSFSGTAFAKNQLQSVIHAMTLANVLNNIPFPAEIRPLTSESIVIEWISLTEVKVWMVIRPYECPKDITVGIMLDLSVP